MLTFAEHEYTQRAAEADGNAISFVDEPKNLISLEERVFPPSLSFIVYVTKPMLFLKHKPGNVFMTVLQHRMQDSH